MQRCHAIVHEILLDHRSTRPSKIAKKCPSATTSPTRPAPKSSPPSCPERRTHGGGASSRRRAARRVPEITGAAVEAYAGGAARGSRRRSSWRALPLHPGRGWSGTERLKVTGGSGGRAITRQALFCRETIALTPYADPEPWASCAPCRWRVPIRPPRTSPTVSPELTHADPCTA